MTAGDVIVGDLGIAQVLDIEARSVGEAIAWAIAVPRFLFGPRCTDGCFEFFGKAQTQGVALIEAHLSNGYAHPSGKVLPEVEQDATIFGETYIARVEHFLHHHRRCRVAAHLADGQGAAFGLSPLAIVEVSHGPSDIIIAAFRTFRTFQITSEPLCGIVNLTIVFVRRTDGAVGSHTPVLFVGGDDIACSVSIFDDEVGTQRGVAEGWYLVELLLLLHGIVATIRDGDGKAVSGVAPVGRVRGKRRVRKVRNVRRVRGVRKVREVRKVRRV